MEDIVEDEIDEHYFRGDVRKIFYERVVVPYFDSLDATQKAGALSRVPLLFLNEDELRARIERTYDTKLPEFEQLKTIDNILEWLISNCDPNKLYID